MKTTTFSLLCLAASSMAAPIRRSEPVRREVPQEHSHNFALQLVRDALSASNPKGIEDPVFGLLGNAAAAAGAGSVTDLDCLQQETADQAFTNAKASGNVTQQVGALIYRALERNTGAVGLASVICNETATNPEIDAITQHQDPASTGAAATNKAIVLELAKQISAVGGDPLDALKSGTFEPGTIGDPTAAGNTCDVEDDTVGCIITQNLLVDDATEAEISAAVAGVSVASTAAAVATDAAATTTAAASAATTAAADDSACTETVTATTTVTVTAADTGSDAECTVATVTVTVAAAAASATAANDAAVTTSAAAATSTTAAGQNLQTFTGALGGISAPAVTTGDRGFVVSGETGDSFLNVSAALQRSCSIQHNQCADAANASQNAGFTVGDCDTQNTQCTAA